MSRDAAYWIEKLQLTRHVEGGSFREVYRSSLTIGNEHLPKGFHNTRNFSTSIYFLLESGQFSAFHKIASDEVWHFYYGDPLIVYEIDSSGSLVEHLLGNDPEKGESFQTVIRAGNWFGSKPANGSAYALVGCTVSPGFDFEDFELADRRKLSEAFPQHTKIISELTYS